MTLEGCDISAWQPTTPDLDPFAFVFCRATYGTTRDAMFQTHASAVCAAGKVLGAYHFGTSVPTVADQVKAFLSASQGTDLLALDLETEPGEIPMSASQARLFIAGVHAAGLRIGLYHSLSGFPTDLGQDWNWVASWGRIAPSIPWTFWQKRGSPLDLDVFQGDAAALSALAEDRTMPMTSPVPDGPATYLVDVAAGGTAYYDLGCTQVAKPNPMTALVGVVTYGTANRPLADHLLMRAIAHPSGFVAWVGATKCSHLRPKTPPAPVQTLTVTGQGIKVAGPA